MKTKMIQIELTPHELRALRALLADGNPCRSGCVFEEMSVSKIECDRCPFTDALYALEEKLSMCDG